MNTAKDVLRELRKLGTKERAASSAWYFKTRKGEYGYGDVFTGVTVPEQRKLAKMFSSLSLSEITRLLENKIHEARLTSLIILVEQYKKGNSVARRKIAKFYLAHIKYINNWDLVDTSASNILGQELLNKKREILYLLVKSTNLWERRIAIVASFAFIREGDFADTLNLSGLLLNDKEDLIHKAVGWMLREVGKQSRPTLIRFLNENTSRMPRTTLRYAIEHFSEKERKRFMNMK